MRILVAIVLLAGRPSFASPGETEIAVGVNAPFRWADAFGASLYVGLTPHQALRGNVARYAYTANPIGDLIDIASGGDGSEASWRGDIIDVGVAWMYFPRRVWNGFFVEAGVLRRARDHAVEDEFASPELVETRTTTYAARAMIGWSWLFEQRLFVSIAAGLSAGHEAGTETTSSSLIMSMPQTHDVARFDLAAEGFLRIGATFGL